MEIRAIRCWRRPGKRPASGRGSLRLASLLVVVAAVWSVAAAIARVSVGWVASGVIATVAGVSIARVSVASVAVVLGRGGGNQGEDSKESL